MSMLKAGRDGRVRPRGESDDDRRPEPKLTQEYDGVSELIYDMDVSASLQRQVRALERARKRGSVPHTVLPASTPGTLIARAYRISARGQLRDLNNKVSFDRFTALIKSKSA